MRSKLVLLMAALSVGSVGVLTAWPGEEPKPQAKAKAESPKAEPPQPEAPKEDFGRLPRDKRAKLLETVESGLSENSTLPLWLEGGKKLLLVSEYEKNSGGNLGPYGGVKQVQVISGFSSLRFLGTIDDGKKWLGYERIGSGVNSVSRLRTWDFRDPTNPYSTAIRTVEFDYEADGVPDAVTPDGKIVYTIKAFVEKPGTINKNAKYGFFFRALDANTGEPIRTIARIERDDFYLTHAFSPKRDRLYVMLLHNKENVLCRCIDPSTGKLVWERTFDGKLQWLQPNRVTPPLFTADGQTVVLNAPYTSELPPAPPRKVPGPPGMRIGDPGSTRPFLSAKFHLIDSTTGKDRVEIALRKDVMNEVIAISPDGRLLAGTVTEPKQPDADGPPPSQLVVWDSRTGQALKRWELGGSRALFVTFAPNRPLMLLWQMGDDRGAKNTLGLWDLSGLLK